MGQLSLCSEVLLLPHAFPPTPAPAMLRIQSFPRPRSLEGAHHRPCGKCTTKARWRQITQRDPSVVRSMSRHFAIVFCPVSFLCGRVCVCVCVFGGGITSAKQALVEFCCRAFVLQGELSVVLGRHTVDGPP